MRRDEPHGFGARKRRHRRGNGSADPPGPQKALAKPTRAPRPACGGRRPVRARWRTDELLCIAAVPEIPGLEPDAAPGRRQGVLPVRSLDCPG
jgi:hypothetical protein